MSFNKFQQKTATPFELYYDRFLQNSMARKLYIITLLDDDEFEIGIPTAGSIADPRDPEVRFYFRADNGKAYRIPFREISDAQELIECRVHTLAPNTEGGSDFSIYLKMAEVEKLLGCEEPDTPHSVLGYLLIRTRYDQYAPIGTYKYLTVHAMNFSIDSIEKQSAGSLLLKISKK